VPFWVVAMFSFVSINQVTGCEAWMFSTSQQTGREDRIHNVYIYSVSSAMLKPTQLDLWPKPWLSSCYRLEKRLTL